MKSTDEWITLHIPASAEYVDLVRMTLFGIAAKMGFDFEEIEDMKVAVSEACNNAILHAYGPSDTDVLHSAPQARIEVRFLKREAALSIVVKDEGRSFDAVTASQAERQMPVGSIEELHVGGLGLYLMQALMDQVEVRSDTGTEVVMTKRLARGDGPI